MAIVQVSSGINMTESKVSH